MSSPVCPRVSATSVQARESDCVRIFHGGIVVKVLIYGINYSPELTGIGKYSGEMGAWLANRGHDVVAVTAPPYYPKWRIREGYSRWRITNALEQGVRVYRCPLYVPSQPTALTRILHLLSFSIASCFALLRLGRWRPDLVVYVVPTLFCALQALLYSRLTGAKIVLHVQDYEVDALFGLGLARIQWLSRLAFWVEKRLMSAFDCVSTISPGMMARAVEKGVDRQKLLFFPNWSEVERFIGVHRSDALLQRLGVDAAKKIVLYSGNMGDKQGLEIVLEVASRAQLQSDWIFLMVGEGAGKARLQALATQMRLSNVVFSSLLPYDDLPILLASADCHLVVQKSGVADAVLPSKLTNILAVGGNAVITAEADTSLGLLCREFSGIGVCVKPESADALMAGIEMALSMPHHNQVACDYAKDNLDKHTILTRFMNEI